MYIPSDTNGFRRTAGEPVFIETMLTSTLEPVTFRRLILSILAHVLNHSVRACKNRFGIHINARTVLICSDGMVRDKALPVHVPRICSGELSALASNVRQTLCRATNLG